MQPERLHVDKTSRGRAAPSGAMRPRAARQNRSERRGGDDGAPNQKGLKEPNVCLSERLSGQEALPSLPYPNPTAPCRAAGCAGTRETFRNGLTARPAAILAARAAGPAPPPPDWRSAAPPSPDWRNAAHGQLGSPRAEVTSERRRRAPSGADATGARWVRRGGRPGLCAALSHPFPPPWRPRPARRRSTSSSPATCRYRGAGRAPC